MDVPVVVLETGSAWTRAGYAGEGAPRHVLPTPYARLASGDSKLIFGPEIHTPEPGKEVFSPMADGCVQDWKAVSALWKHVYDNELAVSSSEYPLVLAEPVWHPAASRTRMLETVFEDLAVPIFSAVKAPICVTYESAVPTALIVDVGAAVASVTPVVEGTILTKGAFHTRFAGDFINLHLMAHLRSRVPDVATAFAPYCCVDRKLSADPGQKPVPTLRHKPGTLTESFMAYQTSRLLTEFKATTSQISETPFNLGTTPGARTARSFEFPSGFNLAFGPERFATVEPLFRPAQYSLPDVAVPEGPYNVGLGDLITTSLSNIDPGPDGMRIHQLLGNIILAGGTTLLPGMAVRIENEIAAKFPNVQAKFYQPLPAERKAIVWTGASILGSMGTFDPAAWITRAEYAELGAEQAEKKFK